MLFKFIDYGKIGELYCGDKRDIAFSLLNEATKICNTVREILEDLKNWDGKDLMLIKMAYRLYDGEYKKWRDVREVQIRQNISVIAGTFLPLEVPEDFPDFFMSRLTRNYRHLQNYRYLNDDEKEVFGFCLAIDNDENVLIAEKITNSPGAQHQLVCRTLKEIITLSEKEAIDD